MKRKLLLGLVGFFLLSNVICGQTSPDLGATSSFALFTGNGAFDSNGATVVKGNIGSFTVTPAITSPGVVNGTIYTVGDAALNQPLADVSTAYTDLFSRVPDDVIAIELAGQTLTPGVHSTGAATTLTGNVTLDGQGNPNSIFIIQINGALTTSTFSNVILINSASPNNVYWQMSGAFTLGNSSVFRGNIVSGGAIGLLNASSLIGRGLTKTGAIHLDNNVVTLGNPPATPTVTLAQPTCSVSTGTITITAPTDIDMTYSIDGSTYINTTGIFSSLTPGTYNVTAMNSDGYVSLRTTVTINAQPSAPVEATASTTIQPTCAVLTGTIVVTAPLGAGYEYNIDGGVYQASATFAAIAAGSHNILVRRTTDHTCISGVTTVDVTAATAPVEATASTTIQPTCAVLTGTIVVTAPLGTGYEYNIDGGVYQASATFAGIAAGSHTILVRRTTDITCISGATVVTVDAATVPADATASTTIQPTCAVLTGTIVVTAPLGAGYEYNIDGGVYQASVTFAGIAAGSHNILVRRTTDITCISGATAVMVTAATAPADATASTTIQPTCAVPTGTIVVTAPLGAGYEYNIDGGVYQTSATFAGIAAGSHSILVRRTTDNTCISGATAVTVNAATAPAVATASTTIQPTCAVLTGTIVVTAPLGTGYEYNIDGGVYQASATFAGVAPGSHNILVRRTTDITCISGVTIVDVTAATAPADATASTTIQPTCAVLTGTIVVTAPLGAGYEYNIDGGVYQTSATFAGIAAGSHNILVRRTTDNTCISGATAVTITAATAPADATASTTIQPTCAVPTGTIVVTAPLGTGYEYNIDGGVYQASATFAGIAAGSHNILVRRTTDITCISGATAVMVTAATAPADATASTTIQPTCAVPTGTIVVTAPLGAGYEYNIDGGVYQASATFAGIAVGSHNILVRRTTDVTCISGVTAVTVNAATVPADATASTPTQPTCAVPTGTIVVTAPLGAGYEYNIDGGAYQASATFAGIAAGSHTILVRRTTDITCISGATAVTVDAATVPADATASTTIQPTCAVLTGTIVVTAPLGAGYEYNIDGGVYQTSATFAGIAAGSHTILVRRTTDITCISGATAVTVNAATAPANATVSVTIQPTCSLPTGTIFITAPLGAGYEYNIDGGAYQTSVTFTGIAAGLHNILVRSPTDNTCISGATAVTVNAQPPIPNITNQTISILTDGTFSVTPSGVPAGTTYTWIVPTYTGGVTGGIAETGQTDIHGILTLPSGTGTATYIVTPTSELCSGATFTVIVTVTDACVPVTIRTQPADNSMCIISGNAIFTTVANGTAPFTYQWQYNNGGTWANVTNGTPAGSLYTNATTATLNVAGTTTSGNYQYRCYITNCSNSNNATSNAATLTANPLPTPTITGLTIVPTLASTVYTTQAGMTSYIWTVSAGGTITSGGTATDNTVTVTWNTTGAQTVAVNYNNATNCTAVIPTVINVTVGDLPIPTITGPTPVCVTSTNNAYVTEAGMTAYSWTVSAGGTITAGGTTTDNTATIIWNTAGAQNVSVNYTNGGGYTAAIPTVKTVTVNSTPSMPTYTLIQPNSTVTTGTITVITPIETGMTYSIDGLVYTNTTGVFTEFPGTYSITAMNSTGCISVPVVVIIEAASADLSVLKTVDNAHPIIGQKVVFAIVAANNGPDTATGATVTDIIESGYTYVSSTTTVGTYNPSIGVWTIGTLHKGAIENLTITATVKRSGSYVNTAIITSEVVDGNVGNNTSTIITYPTDFFIPDGFSPNGDGINDLFVIRGVSNFPKNKIKIFNRWGNKVYEASPYINKWDGRSMFGLRVGGNELPIGTYFYILDLMDGSDIFKGTIYLNR